MTRPTDCTTSTCELRGVRKRTASSDGTSTPSDKQRTLDRIRQVFSGAVSFNQVILSFFSVAFIPPSTCLTSQLSFNDGSIYGSSSVLYKWSISACWYASTTALNISVICLELTLCFLPLYSFSITWQKATARSIGFATVPSGLYKPCLARAFQQPTIFAASSTFRELFSSFNKPCNWRLIWLSSTASTITL